MANIFTKVADYITGRDVQKAARIAASYATNTNQVLADILTGNSPGTWSSDHYKESEQYREFQYIAVRCLANQMLQAKIETDIPESHPAYKILVKPNGEQSNAIFNYARAQQSYLTGTCVTWDWKENENNGELIEKRYVIPTALLSPSPNGFRFAWRQASANTNIWMQVPTELLSNKVDFIPYNEVSINRFVSPLYLGDGTAPTSAAASWIDTIRQIGRAWFNENANAVRPGLVITESALSQLTKEDRQRVQMQILAEYGGSENAAKNLWLPKGLEAAPWAKTSQELANLESFKVLRDSILAVYGVTPIAAGILEAGNRSAYYAALLQFVELTVQPYLDLLGEEDTLTLRRYYGDELAAVTYKARRIDDPDVIKQQHDSLTNAIKLLATTGAVKRNEIRKIVALMFPNIAEVIKPLSAAEGGEEFTRTVRETVNGGEESGSGPDTLDAKPSLMKGDASHAA